MEVGQEEGGSKEGAWAPAQEEALQEGKTTGAGTFKFGDTELILSYVDDVLFTFRRPYCMDSACLPFSLRRLLATATHSSIQVPGNRTAPLTSHKVPSGKNWNRSNIFLQRPDLRLHSSRWGVARKEHRIWGPRAWVWILSYSLGDCGQVASTQPWSPSLMHTISLSTRGAVSTGDNDVI